MADAVVDLAGDAGALGQGGGAQLVVLGLEQLGVRVLQVRTFSRRSSRTACRLLRAASSWTVRSARRAASPQIARARASTGVF